MSTPKFQLERLELIDNISPRINMSRMKLIAIVGLPATGKTTMAKLIYDQCDIEYDEGFGKLRYAIHSSDDYIGYVHPLSSFEGVCHRDERQEKIIEGCQVVNVLLLGDVKPDLIIECVADKETRFARSKKETPIFDRRLKQAWAQYMAMNTVVPVWVHDTSLTQYDLNKLTKIKSV